MAYRETGKQLHGETTRGLGPQSHHRCHLLLLASARSLTRKGILGPHPPKVALPRSLANEKLQLCRRCSWELRCRACLVIEV